MTLADWWSWLVGHILTPVGGALLLLSQAWLMRRAQQIHIMVNGNFQRALDLIDRVEAHAAPPPSSVVVPPGATITVTPQPPPPKAK